MGPDFPGGNEHRRRRRRSTFPAHIKIVDFVLILLLLVIPAGVIWILGGNRDWIMMPVILAMFPVGLIFAYRMFITPYRVDVVIPPGGWVGFLFLAYLMAMIYWVDIPYDAGAGVFRFISYLLAFWMWINLLRFNGRWKWALAIVMVSVSAMAGYAIMQEVQGTRMAFMLERHPEYGMRASGAYVCPNHFANLLQMLMLVSLGLLAAPGIGIPLKLFAGYTILIGLYPLYLSLSRAGWVGMMLGATLFFVLLAYRKGAKLFLAVLVAAPLVVGSLGVLVWKISPKVQARVAQTLGGDVRIPLWKDSIEMVNDAPWLGHGLGSYRHMYPSYHVHMTANRDPEFAHNDFIHFWSEIGIVGLLLAGAMALLVIIRALRIIHRHPSATSQALMCGLLAMMAGTYAHSFFDFNFNIFGNVHVFIFLMGALIAATYERDADTTINVQGRTAPVYGLVLMITLGIGAWFYAKRSASYYYEVKGEFSAGQEDWAAAEQHFARSVDWFWGNWKSHLVWGHALRIQAFWIREPERRAKLVEAGERQFKIVASQNPWSPEPLYGLGYLARIRKDNDASLDYMRQAVERAPRYTSYLNELGQQLRRMNMMREALEVFNRSLSIQSTTVAEANKTFLERRLAEQSTQPAPATN